MRLIKTSFILALGWTTYALAAADVQADPTRPPAAWLATQPQAPGTVEPQEDPAAGLRLLVVSKSRKFAVIDGQVVKPGDSYNGAKVLAIRDDAVVLQDDGATKTLKLAPGIEKRVKTNESRVGRVTK